MQARRFWNDKRTNGTESVVFDKDRESILPQSMQVSATLHAGHVEIIVPPPGCRGWAVWTSQRCQRGESRLSPFAYGLPGIKELETEEWATKHDPDGGSRTYRFPLRSLGYIKFSAFCLVDQLARSRTSNLGSGDPGTRIENSAASQEQIGYTMDGSNIPLVEAGPVAQWPVDPRSENPTQSC
ncbi:conserved hypothetical protein [Coccidioides posadasii str. Silveira]|uniref:Uncharacterized protein n=1 Tax=Coccidioides posadasii (strain RMSCC 757 / Silveira) TaxID=443226 RepID=E9CXV4_COCPS|nr:conserved hypothetical protein [Coccidioides posadasii str. Silveira]